MAMTLASPFIYVRLSSFLRQSLTGVFSVPRFQFSAISKNNQLV
jgi:hypothetical protein